MTCHRDSRAPRQERDHERRRLPIPALGKVVKVTAADLTALTKLLSGNLSLAAGIQPALPGPIDHRGSPGVDATRHGDQQRQPVGRRGGQPAARLADRDHRVSPAGNRPQVPLAAPGAGAGQPDTFRARVTGATDFHSRAADIAHSVGRANSIRADQGQPITIGSIGRTGNGVTINSPRRRPAHHRPELRRRQCRRPPGRDATTKAVIGDNVSIGNGAVVDRYVAGQRVDGRRSRVPAQLDLPGRHEHPRRARSTSTASSWGRWSGESSALADGTIAHRRL